MAVTINASTTAGLVQTADTSGVLQLQTGGTTAVTVNASQNVGIGTTSPSSKLTTSGATGSGNGLTIVDTDYSNDTHQIYGNNSLHLSAGTGGAGAILFRTGGSERARFNTTGALVLAGGSTSANGTGITFPATQSASSDANTLDDYEEGTWTPSFTLDSGSATASSNTGSYIKIGKQVTVTLAITFSVPSAADMNDITGLPFTVSSLSQRGVGAVKENANTGFAWLLRTNASVTTANLRRYDSAQALTNGMQFLGSVTYFTD